MADRDRPRSRHAEALAELVEERYERMVRYAASRLRTRDVPRSSADPEDIVQTAVKSVLAHDEPIRNVRSYLYTCMDHEIDRAARHHHTGRGYESLDADVRLENEPAVRPIEEAELRHVIDEALAGLPLQQRRAMLLTRELGMTQAQAAQVMGAAAATVGVHTHRATRTLRVALVGMGTALVSWAAGSMALGRRQVIPGAGPEMLPGPYTMTMITLIVAGLTTTVLGWGTVNVFDRLVGRRWPFASLGVVGEALRKLGEPDGPGRRVYREPPSATHTRVVQGRDDPHAQTNKRIVPAFTRAERIRRTGAAAARVRAQAAQAGRTTAGPLPGDAPDEPGHGRTAQR